MVDQAMSDLIGLIYEAAIQPAVWPQVMARLAAVAPSAIATFYAHDMVARTPAFQAQHGIEPFWMQEYVERWAADNPIVAAMHRMEPGQVADLETIMDYAAFTSSGFFREWGRPQGFVDAANIMLERTPTRVASVSLIRHDRHGRTDEATLERLRLLAPHFLRAARIGRALDFAVVEKDALEASLDALSTPVVLFDDRAAVVHANRRASELLRQTVLAPRLIAAMRGQAQLPSQPCDPGERVFLLDGAGGARYVCHWMPLEPALRRAAAGMLVLCEAAAMASAAKRAAEVFGLTPRERDVFFCVAELGGATAAAASLGISGETARTHLRSIFAKTQSRSQFDLIRLATQFATPFVEAR